jgi:hypothetical protein
MTACIFYVYGVYVVYVVSCRYCQQLALRNESNESVDGPTRKMESMSWCVVVWVYMALLDFSLHSLAVPRAASRGMGVVERGEEGMARERTLPQTRAAPESLCGTHHGR